MNRQDYEDMVKAMQQEKDGGNSKFWKPGSKKEGKFPIRILPPMKKNGEKAFFFSHKTHYIDNIPYECSYQAIPDSNGEMHQAEPCPICAFVSKLYNSSEKGSDEWKLAGDLKAKKRYVSRIIVRGKDDETTPEFYEYGPRIWEKLFNIIVESEFGNILDAKEGRDFIIHKTGTGRGTNYDNSTPSLDKTPIFSDKDDMIKCFQKATEMKYADLIEFKSVEELDKALRSYISGSKEEDSGPAVSAKTHKPTPKVKQESVDDDYDNEESEIEDDEIDSILGEFVE